MRCAALYCRPPIPRGVSASQIRADHAANQARMNALGPVLPSQPQLRGDAKQGRREMQSSHSGLQRLSQAVLSRSQFLQLAAGALLPFVGLPPSAAAAKNPELAQNGGAPGTKDAPADRMGAILVSQFGPVKIHSFLSPLDGVHVNTQMV